MMSDTQESARPKREGGRKRATRTKARRYAMQAIYQWQISQDPPKEVERQFRHEHGLIGADSRFFAELFHGTTSQCERIDRLLATVTDRPVAAIDPVERAILRLATYELLRHKETSVRAIINEAVELAKIFGSTPASYKYINAVLDRLATRLRPEEKNASRGRI